MGSAFVWVSVGCVVELAESDALTPLAENCRKEEEEEDGRSCEEAQSKVSVSTFFLVPAKLRAEDANLEGSRCKITFILTAGD